MHRSLSEYRIFRELLDDYAAYCQPHEVALRDITADHTSATMLASLGNGTLDAPIVRMECVGGQPDLITIKLPDGAKRTYALIWNPDRYGWACPLGGRTVHFFAPRAWIKDPPYCGAGMLAALCKRNFLSNDAPFWPVDDPQYCKTCSARYQEFLAEVNAGA